MKTELASPTGLVPEQVAPPSSADVLELAVERVLAAVRPSNLADPLADPLSDPSSGARRAEESLLEALRRAAPVADGALGQAVACAEAAAEHLRYGELQEARLLLVAARGQIVRSQTRRA
ncbi:hypothetical protein [Saccharothrix algeriensis]|uniref:Uncharacterized protein n=1 Tax=Saccharothrix algeriensis TaxID=173560 RepID=A0A8T8HVC6_9PSEU|nr:hypothetical protein [Saccharothrix algeriensis]MBM7814141.1 hypothetical protein [Saccharothrix algeriensis]QTR02515.1 hypothetical protein J7S33_25935 [Saccharothrix algeriensis]